MKGKQTKKDGEHQTAILLFQIKLLTWLHWKTQGVIMYFGLLSMINMLLL